MELEPGEVICSKCNGTGKYTSENEVNYKPQYVWHCDKCRGTGKLDWIENIVGKRPKYLSINWPHSVLELDGNSSSISNEYIKALSDQLARSIDEEILKSLYEGTWTNEK